MIAGQTKSLLRGIRHTLAHAAGGPDTVPDEQLLAAFVNQGDVSAFAGIVRRHGSLVLAACRQVLRDEADVEDAFQATFLVLLRKAASVRRGQALSGWLFRVAHRLALEARAKADRRRQREARAADRRAEAGAADTLTWREACAALHEELDLLPERYRLPLLLCYLQGRTRDEAARQLGWTLQSLKGRLERGRRRLRDRLARRGITLTLSAGLLAALADEATAASLPRLIRAVLRVAATGATSAPVSRLVEGFTGLRSPARSSRPAWRSCWR
jgi:RNA polymerase sigma factor (sigma-70 family)